VADAAPQVEDAVSLARAAVDASVPERTARRWRTRYRAEGLVGLARPARTDRGRRRFSADLVAFVADTLNNDAWGSFRRMPC
jgi:putative transposase